jgi:hypothetical protein
VSERPVGAEFLLLVVEPVVLPAVSVPLELEAALVVEPGLVPAVSVPLDDEMEDDEGDGLGHKLLYTNCSGEPLQAVTDPALNVPFGYIQQLPEAYGELPGFFGLKTT